MPNNPEGASSYMAWRALTEDALLPPPALPVGRRSFGCPQMAEAATLYCGARSLMGAVRELPALAARLMKPAQAGGEGEMPAGYTYLGQLMAHDLCTPTEGEFDYALSGPAPGFTRQTVTQALREHPLHLESLFGPITADAALPVLHRFPPAPLFYPYFAADIPRRKPVSGPGRSLGDLPDTRNDDNPMIAQLSALFIAHAERVTARLAALGHAPADSLRGAKVATARMWHRILLHDLLPRLALPELADLPADLGAPGGKDIPVEVTAAILRAGHWLVRSQYQLNVNTIPIRVLLKGEPDIAALRARPGGENFWRIDWRNFFDLDSVWPPQRAMRLEGGLTAMFGSDFGLPETMEIHAALVASDNDLALRDLARSADSGLQTVTALAARLAPALRDRFPDWVLWDDSARANLLSGWCAACGHPAPGHLTADPPLYLYALLEAGTGPRVRGFGEGLRLGALGSALLWSSVKGAVEVAASTLPDAPADPDLPLIDDMPSLVRFLTLNSGV